MASLKDYHEMIANNKPIRLSAKFTKIGIILALIGVLFGIGLMYYQLAENGKSILDEPLIWGTLLIGLLVVSLQIFIAVEYATLTGKLLRIKKVFGQEQKISVDKVNINRSFWHNGLKYTVIQFQNRNGYKEWALIMNASTGFLGSRLRPGKLIQIAQETYSTKSSIKEASDL